MTAGRHSNSEGDADTEQNETPSDEELPVRTVLSGVLVRFRSDLRLAVPFLVAGLLVGLVDIARRRDPIPTTIDSGLDGLHVELPFLLYPSGAAQTTRSLGAIVELRLPYLLWAVAVELLPLLAVGVAGWLVVSRALGIEPRERSLGVYLGAVLVLTPAFGVARTLFPTFRAIAFVVIAVPLLLLCAAALTWLFLVPVYLIAGFGLRKSIRLSRDAVQGTEGTVFILIGLFTLAMWLLSRVPLVGGALSTAVVAPIHAVAAVFIHDNVGPDHLDTVSETTTDQVDDQQPANAP